MKAKHSLLGCLLAALLYALPTSASAQCSGIFNAGDTCGNPTASGALASRTTLTAMFDRAFCGTNNSTTIRLAGTWICLSLGTNVPAFLTTPSVATFSTALSTTGTPSATTFLRGDNSWSTPAGAGTVTAGSGGVVPTSGSPSTLFIEQMNPGGRLTVVSGGCNVSTDQVAQTTLYYAPCGGEWVPVYDGTDMKLRQFTSSTTDTVGLSIALGSNWGASTLYDAFVGVDSGTVRLCTGPAWTNSGAGTSTRGTGAGTTQLAILKGMLTNAVSMACKYNNTTNMTCGVNQCTYVGTFIAGASNGTIDLKFGTAASGGGLALLSICNQYNRITNRTYSADSGSNWTYNSGTFRAANAGNTKASVVSCNGDVAVTAIYAQYVSAGAGAQPGIGLGLNASNALASRSSGPIGPTAGQGSLHAHMDEILSSAGFNTIFAIENSSGGTTTFQANTNPFNFQQLEVRAEL